MGVRTTLSLLVCVAALGGLLVFTSQVPPREDRVEIPALDGRSLGQCARFRWQFRSQVGHEVERRGDGAFELIEPIVDRASMAHMRQIVSAWDSANLVATELSDDERGRREAGLDSPVATFFAEWPDGYRVSYDVGAPGPLGTDRFLRRDGVIWRGSTALIESLRVNDDDLRDRQVFTNREPFCQSLRLELTTSTGKREVIELERRENRWRMLRPYDGRVEQKTAVRFVTALLSLRVDTFLGGLVRPGEGEPDVVVDVRGGAGEEHLRLWVAQGYAYGQLPGRSGWFQTDPRTFESVFEREGRNLRSKALVSMASVAEELAEVVIDPGQGRGERVHLLRRSVSGDDGWRLVEPIAIRAGATPANEMVQAVHNLYAVEFVEGGTADDQALGLRGPERIAVTLRAFDEKRAETIWLGNSVRRGDVELVHACRADEPGTVVLVPKPAISRLLRPWTDYPDREVLRINVQIGRLELVRDGERRVFGAEEGGRWELEGGEGDFEDVGYFVNDNLRDLLGEGVVDLRDGRGGSPDWTMVLARANGDVLRKVRVWDPGAPRPLVLQPEGGAEIGYRVNPHVSKQLRALWR